MASVYKRKNSKYWIACYTSRDGRQLKRSTKTTDKRKAKEVAFELERTEQKLRQGQLVGTQIKKYFNEVSEKVIGETLLAKTTAIYLNEWLDTVAVRSTPSTLERYKHSVKLFLESLQTKAQKPITEVSARDVEIFLTSRLKAGLAPKTASVDLKTINVAFRRAMKHGVIDRNPIAAVQLPKESSSERDVFTLEEVQKLVNVAPTHEWQTLILLGYFVGARLRDCVKMSWDNVKPETNYIEYEQQKTRKTVRVPIHFNLLDHLNFISTFGTTGFLCPKLAGKMTGGRRGLSETFKRIVKKAGLDLMTVQGKGIRKFSKRTFHSLRHSFNSALANAGVSQEVRMKLTGHASPVMNKGYTHLQDETLKKAMTSLAVFS